MIIRHRNIKSVPAYVFPMTREHVNERVTDVSLERVLIYVNSRGCLRDGSIWRRSSALGKIRRWHKRRYRKRTRQVAAVFGARETRGERRQLGFFENFLCIHSEHNRKQESKQQNYPFHRLAPSPNPFFNFNGTRQSCLLKIQNLVRPVYLCL